LQIIGAVLLFPTRYSRAGALIYLLSFGYIFILDISYYNIHFYFVLLLCLIFTMYDPVKFKNAPHAPRYLLYLFQFQVIVVYFYGGIVKLNEDWLFHQEPMREMLFRTNSHSWPEFVVYLYTYGGLIFDLSIGFLLLIPSTRKLAVTLTIVFHVLNHFMFSAGESAAIGIFPFLMIATNLFFLDAEKMQQVVSRFVPASAKKDVRKKGGEKSLSPVSLQPKKIVVVCITVYVVAQLLLPLRHFLIPGNVDWTGEGYYFSWRMKIRSKKVDNTIYVQSDPSAERHRVYPLGLLNTLQYQMVCEHPAAMHYFVQYLKRTGKEKMNMKDPHFYLNWKCAMNGHPYEAVVDSSADFGALSHHMLTHDSWINPFE